MRSLAAAAATLAAATWALANVGGSAQENPRGSQPATHLIGVEVDAFRRTERGLRECQHIAPSDRPPGGGCLFTAAGGVQFTILTPFGGMAVGDCELQFDIRMDSAGFVAMEELVPDGPDACSDFGSCEKASDAGPPPWLGEIETDGKGGYRVLLAACLDTGFGGFEGTLRLALKRSEDKWQLTADRAMLDQSGIQLHGKWRLTPSDLALVVDDDGGVPRRPGLN